jgi:hypothetical protein
MCVFRVERSSEHCIGTLQNAALSAVLAYAGRNVRQCYVFASFAWHAF